MSIIELARPEDDVMTLSQWWRRGFKGTIACERCAEFIEELLLEGPQLELQPIVLKFLDVHTKCGSLVVLQPDERGDLYISNEILLGQLS